MWFEKLRSKYRKHDFDLEKPYRVEQFLTLRFPVYKCKNCDKTLALDLWQMKALPPSMARGCDLKRR